MTPDMSADTWLGAAGCARGSQTWSGITPALPAKPSARRTKAASRVAGARAGAAARQSANRRLPTPAPSRSMPASKQARPAWVMTA